LYLIRPPLVYRWLFKQAIFRKNTDKKEVFLTFDDGPQPEATEFVLGVLNEHGIKATFFMLGKNVREQFELVEKVRKNGHIVANHGMNHLNGWATSTELFEVDCNEGKGQTDSDLFRPPYGRLTLSQYNCIIKENRIVFWDVISGDFDPSNDAEIVKKNVLGNVRNGSIIVMHDSKKALKNLKGSLGGIIDELKKEGYTFGLL